MNRHIDPSSFHCDNHDCVKILSGDLGYIHMVIHCIRRCLSTKMECNLVWSGSWPQSYQSGMVCTQSCSPCSASFTHLHCFDGLGIHPHGHPHHQKKIKHFIYMRWKFNPVWSDSWPRHCQSGMVCTQLLPRFSQFYPPPWLWWIGAASIWPSTASEGA